MQLEVCLKQNLILLWVGSSTVWPKVVTANLHYSVAVSLWTSQSTFLPFTETLWASSSFPIQGLLRQSTTEEAGNVLRKFLLLLVIISPDLREKGHQTSFKTSYFSEEWKHKSQLLWFSPSAVEYSEIKYITFPVCM